LSDSVAVAISRTAVVFYVYFQKFSLKLAGNYYRLFYSLYLIYKLRGGYLGSCEKMEQGLIMLANKKSLLAVSIAASLTLSGCFSDNDNNVKVDPPTPTDPVDVVVPPSDLVTEQPAKVFAASVIDSVSTDVLEGATVSFLVNGEAATSLTDVNNADLASVTVDASGTFTFLSKEGATGEVTAVVSQTGYVTNSFIVDLDTAVEEGAADIPLQFSLVKVAGDSLEEKVEAVAVDGAVTTAAVEVKAETASGTGGAGVTIDASTELRDASGAPVSGGDVTLSVLAADSKDSSVGAIIPEGLNAADATQVATPVGVTNVNMKAGDTKIKQFSKAITVTATLPANSGVAVDDVLDLASHNEDTGQWQNETNKATVKAKNADGTYTAEFQTDHLTFFSINRNAPKCEDGISINVTSGTVPPRGLAVSLTSSDGSIGSYLRGQAKQIVSGNATARYGISEQATARVRIYDYSGNDWYDSGSEVNVCGTIPVQIANPVVTFDADFTLAGTCSNDANVSVDLSGSIVTYAKNGKAASVASSSGNSTFRLVGLEDGATYTIRTTVRGAQVAGGGQSVVTNTTAATGSNVSQAVSLTCQTVPATGA
jgi:hypothetical protein